MQSVIELTTVETVQQHETTPIADLTLGKQGLPKHTLPKRRFGNKKKNVMSLSAAKPPVNLLAIVLGVLIFAMVVKVAPILAAGRNVGYYDMSLGQGNATQVPPITTAGETPVQLTDLAPADLAGIDVLFVQNPSNGSYGAEYLSRLASVQSAVNAGMVLIIHDRYVTDAETILPGGAGFVTVRNFDNPGRNDIDILDNTTLVTNGPGGMLDNTSLDGGNFSNHGYTADSSLPGGATLILSRTDSTQIVTFAYPFGAGWVIYSSIPLDIFLAGGGSNSAMSSVYAPNVVAYGVSLLPAPEIDVLGNGMSIADGDDTPATIDDTDLGNTPITHTFTISNSGTADLTLSDSPAVTLTTDTHFTVTQPASTTLGAGQTTTFTVVFNPQSVGSFTDTVNIANNDSNENPYTFVVSGTGIVVVPDLHISKSVTPTTDAVYHGVVTYTVILSNTGTGNDTVLLTDTLPTEVDFAAWVISPTGTTLNADEFTWSGTVTASQSLTWTFRATHTGSYGDAVTNTARFSGTLQTGEDDAIFTVIRRGGPQSVFQNVPEAGDCILVYALDIPADANYSSGFPAYSIDNTASIGSFDRIAYYLELDAGTGPDWVYTSMDAFTTTITHIGLPVAANGVMFQQTVNNLNVASNVSGVITGNGLSTGNIEFWPSNYGGVNSIGIPNASNSVFDFGDGGSSSSQGYGSFQVHNHDLDGAGPDTAGQTVFAYNRWGSSSGPGDIGIDNRPTGNPDWTFAGNAGTYVTRTLYILACQFPPEIAVFGNSQIINNGSASPTTTDDTDYGLLTAGETLTHTFTISNSGGADLTLSGTLAITLTTGTHFTVTQPASTTLGAGQTTTFTVSFTPQSVGNFIDTVNIANNDDDENPYTFVISGTGSALPVNLSVSGSEAAQTEVTVTATASTNVTGDQTVDLGVSGTGITAGDYALSNTTITILNGQSSGNVTFTVQNDTLAEGDETATLTISNPSAGLTLGTTTSQNVAITDNDGQYTISADLASVTEGDTGTTPITFTVTRSGAYTTTSGSVSFTLGGTASSGDYDNVSPAASVSFATGEVSQTITMDVLGDYVDENPETISVALSSPIVTGGGTASLGTATAQTTINDDDAANIVVSPTSGLVTNESGLTATFTIVLSSQPTATVTIGLSSSNTDEGTVSPASVSFTTLNWNVAQTVTVTGVDDLVSDGDIGYTIVTAAASSSDNNYNNMNPADVGVTNNDNDIPGFTISPVSGLTTTEAGGQATFTVVLNTQPAAGVTLPVSSNDTGEGTVSAANVVFTTLNWNIPQTVTVTGVNDDVADGDQAYTVETGNPTSSDGDYNGASANPDDVSVTNEDNDTAGFTISTISGDTSEDGATATFTVRLNTEPSGNVVINVVSSNVATGTVSPAQLTFTNLTWSDVQTVTVTGVDDGDNPDGDKDYTIQLTVDGSTAATEYDPLDPADVSVVNRDNDVQPIFLPIIFGGGTTVSRPDLVVDSLVATSSAVTITIRNAGTAATPDAFWVDVYFNPNPAPPPINQPWDDISTYGGNWGVTATLNPGQSLTLVTGDAYYVSGSGSFPSGANVYAYVDSVNHATTYGNIRESNENNNVFGPIISIAGSGTTAVTSGSLSSLQGLPQR